MSYRRPKDDGVFSSRWRIAHRADLADCGIPPQVAADDRRWLYVLNHGDDLETGWSVSWLSDEQATNLLALLEPRVPNAAGNDLIQALRRRRRDAGGQHRQPSAREP